jgi:alpha-amylase
VILGLINKYKGRFRVAFSISGTAIDQFMIYAPEVIESFQKLAATGCVEFLAETYSHSLSALKNKTEFKKQVTKHADTIETLFGTRPTTFVNTELIYSDEIGATIAEMGYKATLTEGPNHILKWRSPNYLYRNAILPELTVLLKNYRLSDDIAFRFSNSDWSGWPLTAKKYVSWLNKIPKKEKIVNLFMDYETFGEHQKLETGIFKFLNLFPSSVFTKSDFEFSTPSDVLELYHPISTINVPFPISWADQERDLSAWLGNELQQEAFEKLYGLSVMIEQSIDSILLKDWQYLQTSDHFYYMSTKYFSDGDIHAYFNPYDSPYDAFMNYMNVLNDFTIRLKRAEELKQLPDAKRAEAVLIQKY